MWVSRNLSLSSQLFLLSPQSQQHKFFRQLDVQETVQTEFERPPHSSRNDPKQGCDKKVRTRRGKRAKKMRNDKIDSEKMLLIGANAAGLLNKRESLIRLVEKFSPAVIFIQKTKARKKNNVKLDNYLCFEAVRSVYYGGGLLTAVHKELHPFQVSNCDDDEIIVVEAKINKQNIRLINGYGPQESSPEETRKSFFSHLDLEIK